MLKSSFATNMIFFHDLSWSLLLFFWKENYVNNPVCWLSADIKRLQQETVASSEKWLSDIQLLQSLRALVGQHYSLNFILLSHFYFHFTLNYCWYFLFSCLNSIQFLWLSFLTFVDFTFSPFSSVLVCLFWIW